MTAPTCLPPRRYFGEEGVAPRSWRWCRSPFCAISLSSSRGKAPLVVTFSILLLVGFFSSSSLLPIVFTSFERRAKSFYWKANYIISDQRVFICGVLCLLRPGKEKVWSIYLIYDSTTEAIFIKHGRSSATPPEICWSHVRDGCCSLFFRWISFNISTSVTW